MVKIPDLFINEIKTLVYTFIWNNGPGRLKREVMVKKYEEDIQKIKWVNIVFTSQSRGWRLIFT